MFDINMYNLSDLPNKVIGESEWYLMEHKLSHHNIVNFISTGRPLKCIPIAQQNFQLPQASGRPLNAHPATTYYTMQYTP